MMEWRTCWAIPCPTRVSRARRLAAPLLRRDSCTPIRLSLFGCRLEVKSYRDADRYAAALARARGIGPTKQRWPEPAKPGPQLVF